MMDSDGAGAAERPRDLCDFNIIELQKGMFKVTLRLAETHQSKKNQS